MRDRIDIISNEKKDLKSIIEDFENLVNLVNSNIENKIFDFSKITWITPHKTIFLTSVFHNLIETNCDMETLNSYLKTIHFPNGLLVDNVENYREHYIKFENKNYSPILKLKIDNTKDNIDLRDEVIKDFISHISNLINLKSNYIGGIRYILSELFDNIFEHSESDYAFLTFQNYPNLKKIEICISDIGIGLLGSYKKTNSSLEKNFSDIITDLDAIKSATEGNSTKSVERGFGIHTSRNIISEGFKGYILYQSGNAIAINDSIFESNSYIRGVIFVMNIPYDNIDNQFSIYNFLE